ncbi:hypothetical protein QEH59_10905 [Coraliomargarita sp. SDUM461004]|uniref:PEP-CTERM sorting domain-containing protein n=1 Tax=Thalassobacterium sedimentorum TaxID=3041258 RepID=A0ABU1AJJ6_9BACT|nr:hypothetical protein [Coraliomargarita sp. SDUM461004]MDQ8194938.1 hypothetical protein [Coraliomargarita sp. SDUM461004]
MKKKTALLVIIAASFTGISVKAQSSLAEWSFDNGTAGDVNNISASSVSSGLTASHLSASGGTSANGIVTATYGTIQATGSDSFDGAGFEVSMDITSNSTAPTSSDYALNFNITVGAGKTLELANFSFDLGYDTNYATSGANYYAPYAQLFVSTNGTSWSSVGSPETLDIADESIFSTGSGSGGVHYISSGIIVDLSSSNVGGILSEGSTAYFRLALSDVGSSSDRRRVFIDNVGITGVIPEVSCFGFVSGALAFMWVMLRRCSV